VEIPTVGTHRFLGILVNKELRWKEHVNYALQKGVKWVALYRRLTKPMKGVSAKYMRQFYIAVAVLKLLYASGLFLIPGNRNTKGTR